MNNKQQKNRDLYIATGILDIISSIILICLLAVFLIFYAYIDGLMAVPGMSSFAGLVYGSLGFALIAVVVLALTIPIGIIACIMEGKLIEKRQEVKIDNKMWLLIYNGIVTVATIFFIFFLIILWIFMAF